MRQLDLFNMEKRRLRKDLVVVFNYLKGIRAQSQDSFLQQKGRGNSHKLQQGKFQVDIWKKKKSHLRAQALEQVAQRDFAICVLGHVQSLTRYCPEEPALIMVLVLLLGLVVLSNPNYCTNSKAQR